MPLISTADRHAVKVKSCQFGETSGDSPKPYVALEFITSGGDTLTGYFYLSPAAFENTVRSLREAFAWSNNFETLEAECLEKECSITTEFEKDEKTGKERLRVRWLNPIGYGVKPIANKDSVLAKFSQLARNVAAKAPVSPKTQAAKPPAAAPTAGAAAPAEDDPFARK